MPEQTNIEKFREAGMLNPEAIGALTTDQTEALNALNPAKVQDLIDLFNQTGEIQHGIFWI